MPVSSLIVEVVEERVAEVVAAINLLDDARVSQTEGSQVIVLTETNDLDADQALWDQLAAMPGVVTVSLIYHNFEDLEERVQ